MVKVEECRTSDTVWMMRWNPNIQAWEEFTWNPDTEPGPPPIDGVGPMWYLEQMPYEEKK